MRAAISTARHRRALVCRNCGTPLNARARNCPGCGLGFITAAITAVTAAKGVYDKKRGEDKQRREERQMKRQAAKQQAARKRRKLARQRMREAGAADDPGAVQTAGMNPITMMIAAAAVIGLLFIRPKRGRR